VAALFLPLVLGLASLLVGRYRMRLARDWRVWLGVSLLALALIAPWFVYSTVVFGREFWRVIVGAHVYTRFTASLDPAHLHPWNHYFVQLIDGLRRSGALWMVGIGAVLFVVETIRRRRADGLVVMLWFAVPIALISLGTSKLYHYAYPFLPPVALAGGFLIAFLWETVRPPLEHALGTLRNVSLRNVVSGSSQTVPGPPDQSGPPEGGHHDCGGSSALRWRPCAARHGLDARVDRCHPG
jgi:4-amino-4-deoxy-L-arabinose transferase-like glycosyltransferase